MSAHPSWLAYSTLRSLCILHGVDVQNVSRRTLYNWRVSGVDRDHIDLLRLRLIHGGYFWGSDIDDTLLACGYSLEPYCSLSRSGAASPACRDSSTVATNGDPGAANT